jgi:hypothetical protein
LNVDETQRIPRNLVWDYGTNEKLDDNKKISTLSAIQRVMSIPYSTRAKIIIPILNKLLDTKISEEDMVESYKEEREEIKVDYGEI